MCSSTTAIIFTILQLGITMASNFNFDEPPSPGPGPPDDNQGKLNREERKTVFIINCILIVLTLLMTGLLLYITHKVYKIVEFNDKYTMGMLILLCLHIFCKFK